MTRARRAVPWRFRWVGVVYLLLVVGAAVFVYLTTWGWLVEPDDGSFAGIWLIAVALPGSLLLLSADPAADGAAAFVSHVGVGLAQVAVVFRAVLVARPAARGARVRLVVSPM